MIHYMLIWFDLIFLLVLFPIIMIHVLVSWYITHSFLSCSHNIVFWHHLQIFSLQLKSSIINNDIQHYAREKFYLYMYYIYFMHYLHVKFLVCEHAYCKIIFLCSYLKSFDKWRIFFFQSMFIQPLEKFFINGIFIPTRYFSKVSQGMLRNQYACFMEHEL